MRKAVFLIALFAASLCLLCGCGRGKDTAEQPQSSPAADFGQVASSGFDLIADDGSGEDAASSDGAEDVAVQTFDTSDDALYVMPTQAPTPVPATIVQPVATATSAVQTVTYTQMTDDTFGFVFSYPSSWVNLPGRYTACYRDPDPEKEFSPRVAVTRKKLLHTPKNETVYKQFQRYAQTIYAQYPADTFEFSSVNANGSFMGQSAYEVTYMAFQGDVEIEGYITCCSIEKNLYVFHFCAAYDDFERMTAVMFRMRDSVISTEQIKAQRESLGY